MEAKVAQCLFEMTCEYIAERRFAEWKDLPDASKAVWFVKARKVIKVIERECPFSPEYRIGR